MTYATGRVYLDADSHVMETADWIVDHADPSIRDRLRPLIPGGFTRDKAEAVVAKRNSHPKFAQRSADEIMNRKGYEALGAWDPTERSRALDVLGFQRQLVFTSAGLFPVLIYEDLDVYYGAVRALNRAMVEFCSEDERLMAVGYVPLVDPERAVTETRFAVEAGCAAVMVPTVAPPDRSPTHPDYDGVWDTLAMAGVPFAVHIGGGGVLLPPAFRNNGRPVPPDFGGGGENIRSKDFIGLHRYPEMFLSLLVLDGLFDRFPSLKGASVEQGAEWVVTLLRRLDQAQDAFRKTEPDLADLKLRPSEYVRRHLRFTPFPFEDVGWITEQVGPELLLFSTDYPHVEGGRDPLGRFERSFDAAGTPEDVRRRFYSQNFAELFGITV
ncbi:MAG TPA: amidohydrolase family protein [Acidimicrobiales bacterium]|nr:amidohydrolase family protein [Acidimicrobiales bacterium]